MYVDKVVYTRIKPGRIRLNRRIRTGLVMDPEPAQWFKSTNSATGVGEKDVTSLIFQKPFRSVFPLSLSGARSMTIGGPLDLGVKKKGRKTLSAKEIRPVPETLHCAHCQKDL